jgi:hypothetical protein
MVPRNLFILKVELLIFLTLKIERLLRELGISTLLREIGCIDMCPLVNKNSLNISDS